MEKEKEVIGESSNVRFPAFRVGIVVALLFVIMIVIGAISFSVKKTSEVKDITYSNSSKQEVVVNEQWKKPVSTKKGIPVFVKDEKLSIYSINSKKLSVFDGDVLGRGYAMGFGNSDPHASPDLLYTAYINKDAYLWIISNETLEKKMVKGSKYAGYISGWSSDSKKVYYYVSPESITTKTEGMGGIPEGKVQFRSDLNSGFFSFNIDTGENKKLYPVENIEAVINEDGLLVRLQSQSVPQNSDRLVIFNTKTFEADYGTVKEKFGYGQSQFRFTADGKKWVFTHSINPTNDANIVLADFPNKSGTVIDTGKWADVQFPNISSDGSKVAYSKINGYSEPGIPNYQVWVYDTATKEKKSYDAFGWVTYWVDNNNVVVTASNASKYENFLYLLNLNSGTATKIY